MLPEEMAEYFVSIGEPKFRAKQTFQRLHRGERIGDITNLSKALRERLIAETVDTLPYVEEKLVSKIDGTVKYLFRLYDGSCIESVFMKYKHGNTLCISSQVGCRMGCKFCASTIGGKARDLYPSELVGQVIAAELGGDIANVRSGMMVTPREIDLIIDRASRVVAMAINYALQPDYSPLELISVAR